MLTERKSTSARPGARAPQKPETCLSSSTNPRLQEGKHTPILPLPSRMCSFVTSSRIPSLCKGWGAQAGEAWAGFGRKTWQATGPAARLPWRPRCPPHLLSPPRCPPAPPGVGGGLRGPCWVLQSQKRGMSKYSRRAAAPGGLAEAAGGRSHGGPRRGRPRSPRTNIAHLFLLTAETSKLMNYK